jgi:hypothetical protein
MKLPLRKEHRGYKKINHFLKQCMSTLMLLLIAFTKETLYFFFEEMPWYVFQESIIKSITPFW